MLPRDSGNASEESLLEVVQGRENSLRCNVQNRVEVVRHFTITCRKSTRGEGALREPRESRVIGSENSPLMEVRSHLQKVACK
jgi:hypothetical protein